MIDFTGAFFFCISFAFRRTILWEGRDAKCKRKTEKKFTHGEHVTIYPDAPESVASATECTGLMPTPPQNDAEFTSYQDLHSMEIPKKLPGKRNFELGVYDDKPEDIQL